MVGDSCCGTQNEALLLTPEQGTGKRGIFISIAKQRNRIKFPRMLCAQSPRHTPLPRVVLDLAPPMHEPGNEAILDPIGCPLLISGTFS